MSTRTRLLIILIVWAIIAFVWLAADMARANAYVIHGPDSDGRYATIRNVASEHPGVLAALPATLEFRINPWSFNNSARTSIQPDGHLRVDLGNTAMNPLFSGLVAHEIGHVLQITKPGLYAAWLEAETAHGFPSSTWRTYPQAGWWQHSPSESWAENFTRALYYSDFSGWAVPRTELAWLSRAEVWGFLSGQGVVVP